MKQEMETDDDHATMRESLALVQIILFLLIGRKYGWKAVGNNAVFVVVFFITDSGGNSWCPWSEGLKTWRDQRVTWTEFTILARMSFSEGNSDTKLVLFYFQILPLVVKCLGFNPWRYVWAVWERRGRINPCVIEKHKSRAKCLLEWDRPRTKDMKKGIIATIPFFIFSAFHQKYSWIGWK